MQTIEEWFRGMLERRGVSRPDSRMLYAYRLGQEEYAWLKSFLSDIAVTGDWRHLALRNRMFAALFVLYCAEWWRREYSGGAWRWSAIFESVKVNPNEIAANERSQFVEAGFAYWGHRTTGDGKRFFGAVVAHGGLPLKALGLGQKKLGDLMSAVLKQAARYQWDESQTATAVADRRLDLPESLRRQEIFELIGRMVCTALELRQEFQIDKNTDPVAVLDRADASWRNRFPISLEDQFAHNLLAGLVKEVALVSDQTPSVGFSVQRILRQVAPDTYELLSTVQHSNVMTAESIKAAFRIERAVELPRYFSIDVQVADREPLTNGRQILGMKEASVALTPQRIQWRGDCALAEHLLFLRGPSGDLHDGPVAVQGGDWLSDDEPYVFAFRDGQQHLVASGSARLPDDEVIVAVRKGMNICEKDGSQSKCEVLGRLHIANSELDLYRVIGEVEVSVGQKYWKVATRQTTDLSRSYVWEGRRVALRTRPWPVYRGKPTLVQYDDDGSPLRVPSDKLKWFAAGTDVPIEPGAMRGPVDVYLYERGVRQARFRMVLTDRASLERYVSSSNPSEGTILLDGWGAEEAALGANIAISCDVKTQGGMISCALKSRNLPPGEIPLHLRWRDSRHDLVAEFPFPASGGRAFDRDGNVLLSGATISLRDLPGARLCVFDQNPQHPQSYCIKLTLTGRRALRQQNGLVFSETLILSASGMAEVRLIDVQTQIETLLAFSDDLDASVRVELFAGGRSCYVLTVARYDLALQRHVLGFSLSESQLTPLAAEQMRRIGIVAIPLTDPGHPAVTLEQLHSEGVPTGVWITSALDTQFAPWLIFPSQESIIQFRPAVYDGREEIGPGELTGDLPGSQGLGAAMSIPHTSMRMEAIEAALVEMSEEFAHPSWLLLDQLWTTFGHLPLSSLDPFRVLATRPDLAACWLIRSQLEHTALQTVIRELKKQLGMSLVLTSFASWRKALQQLKGYWIDLVGSGAAELTFGITLKDRARILSDSEPAIQLSIDMLVDEAGAERSSELLEWMIQLHRNPNAAHQALWQGPDSLLMTLLMRNHANDAEWPEQHFVMREALPALNGALDEDFNSYVAVHGKKLFWLTVQDFKFSVINLPVICALWSIGGLPSDWWKEPSRRLALQRIRAFDPIWFDEAYRHTIASFLGLGLLNIDRQNRLISEPRRNDGPRTIRVPRGTVSAR